MQREEPERVILVGLVCGREVRATTEEHLDELERLMQTAGGEVVAREIQERDAPDPATLVGRGFAEGLRDLCHELEARTVVFDEDLAPSQMRNLEGVLPEDVKLLDRAAVILDIFAQHARSREAQTQVELAQLTYLLPRLTRRWRHLSRQAGGIGTRGVGETQLEIDRRLVSRRITQLKRQLNRIEGARRLRRRRRRQLPTVALVGYTNAGKSSLFRRLTRADVLIEDRLFATLDPRARRLELDDGLIVVLTDTVGFIRKLPHELVAPFRSTLDEAADADLVLHVVDGSHPSWRAHLEVGSTVLEDLGVDADRVVVVVNKIDCLDSADLGRLRRDLGGVTVSALTGEGLDALREKVAGTLLGSGDVQMVRIPLQAGEAVQRALSCPALVARRFDRQDVTIALRTDREGLEALDLGTYRTAHWREKSPRRQRSEEA